MENHQEDVSCGILRRLFPIWRLWASACYKFPWRQLLCVYVFASSVGVALLKLRACFSPVYFLVWRISQTLVASWSVACCFFRAVGRDLFWDRFSCDAWYWMSILACIWWGTEITIEDENTSFFLTGEFYFSIVIKLPVLGHTIIK